MARKRTKKGVNAGNKLAWFLLALAALLTLLQFVFKRFLDIDLGITFFVQEMF